MSMRTPSTSKAVPLAEASEVAKVAPVVSSSSGTAKSSSSSSSSSGSSKSSGGSTVKTVTQVIKEPVIIEVPTGYEMSTAPQIKAQEVPKAEVAKLDKVDISERKQQLADQTEAMKQQAVLNVDKATEQGVADLKENEAAQQPKFQTQRNQIDIDEAKALDNQVLYAEARGDRGGIGKSQYASIQNTAAQNRLAVNAAQIQLSSDTAKQIAKLRTEGEYEKADKLLAISQDYLGRLQELETWADEQNIGIAEFNSKVDQYLSDYTLETAKYKTDVDYKNAQLQQNDDDRKAQIGKTLMAAGVTPTGGMLSAMGLTPSDYLNYRLATL